MQGKTIVITGATSGIGRAMAERLAGEGASLALVGRSAERGDATLERLKEIAPQGDFRFYLADLSRLSEMKRLAAELADREARIDVLINNAGAIFTKRRLTEDGLEMTFALNHVAPFVVTNLLRQKLMDSTPCRVVTTASRAHEQGRIDFDDLGLEKGYSSFKAYCASKLGNILFTSELARRMEGTGVTANCFHPGLVNSRFATGQGGAMRMFRPFMKLFGLSTEAGADTGVFLATDPSVAEVSGQYFVKRQAAEPSVRARDDADARRLWEATAHLAGLDAYQAV